MTQADGTVIKVLNGTSYEASGNLTYIYPDQKEFTRNATSFPRSALPNQLFIMVATDPDYKEQPIFLLEVSMIRLVRSSPDELEEAPPDQPVALDLLDSLSTSQQLTVNEKIVIFSLSFCLLLQWLKIRCCPTAWSIKQ